ncbi:DNA polymerase ligase N-terminal domain-containing protein [Legionella nagasakiensis]|uniref:DNA polymerase ligase N-terminal domain-containing protein n=1 Tax=Legionella nagasakiensis TaxID=535290 RepID=UPI0010565F45|nr:DNA polymerase ligase N-terminal domain-containing protein [Legionella nagasakiensis]
MPKHDLDAYKKKRNFKKTKEPKEGKASKKSQRIFVIQKHDASHLHYDFRLQNEDVLVSWAVPKGLSTVANKKRLAIRTEDHPLDYAQFEGVIPEGEYGAGTVLVWDIGDYEVMVDKDEKSMTEALEEGAFKFKLNGKKLQGGYALARLRKRKEKEQWVIFKLDDEFADARRNPVNTEPDSVLSDRSIEEIAKEEQHDE